MNKPDTFELFDQDDDIKLKEEPVEKMVNASVFDINKEDHTIGNILRTQLLEDETVMFAGYRVPHPLEHRIEIKLQTTNESTPKHSLANAVSKLTAQYEMLRLKFETECNKEEQRQMGTSQQYQERLW